MDDIDRKILTAHLITYAEVATTFVMAFSIHVYQGYAFIGGGVVILTLRHFFPDGVKRSGWILGSKEQRITTLAYGIASILLGLLMLILWR